MRVRKLLLCGPVLFLVVITAVGAFGTGEEDEAVPGTDAGQTAYGRSAEVRTNPDWQDVSEGERVEITGRLRLVGSASFNDLVITDDAGRDWYVDDSERKKLASYEQQVVTLRAIVKRREIVLANGKKLPDRRVLTKVVVRVGETP